MSPAPTRRIGTAWPGLASLALAAAASGAWRHLPPLNDSWLYQVAADRLAATGVLRLTGYGASTQVLHVAAAAGWSFATGGAPWGLYSCLWAAAAVWNLCAFLEESGAPRTASALAGVCLALCPVTLVSLPSLMTEMPYLALSILSLRALARGAAGAGSADLLRGGLWAAAAYLVRQPAVGLPLGAAWHLWRAGRLDARRLAALWGPLAAAAVGHLAWQGATQGATPAGTHTASRVLPFLLDLGSLFPTVAWRATASVLTLGLFVVPLAAAVPGRSVLRAPSRAGLAAFAACAVAAAWHGALPLLGNILSLTGLGALSLPGFEWKEAGAYAWKPAWAVLTAAAAAAAVLAADSASRAGPGPARDAALGAAFGQTAVVLFNDFFLDRYLLAALPGVLAAVALGTQGLALRPLRAWMAAVSLAVFWTVGLLDHVAWNEARWRLAGEGAAAGLDPCSVNAGYEWNAYWCYEPAMRRLAAGKDPASAAPDEWFSFDARRAFVSFAPGLESPQIALVSQEAYRTPLARGGGRLYLYALRAPTPRPGPPPPPGARDGTAGR